MVVLLGTSRFQDWPRRELHVLTSAADREIVKYAITGGIVLLVLAWIIVGTVHAKSRLAKGLPPLAYHRVFVLQTSTF